MTSLSHSTKITTALVIVLLGVAVVFGVQLQKITNLDERVARIEQKLDNLLSFKGLSRSQ